jgi:hypothetical protein
MFIWVEFSLMLFRHRSLFLTSDLPAQSAKEISKQRLKYSKDKSTCRGGWRSNSN